MQIQSEGQSSNSSLSRPIVHGNPVLWPETELELNGQRNAIASPKSGGVWWDPEQQLFRMWYEAGWIHTICYAVSRDGIHWDRPKLDVQLWFYYTGVRGDASRLSDHWLENGMYDRGSAGVAFLRRDGFASMDAGQQTAALTTRPVRFSGEYLFVNVDCPAGSLRVEAIDADHKPIAPFTADRCVPISTDSTLTQVAWEGGGSLAELRGRPVRFRFHLTAGSLFAFWVSPTQDGRSGGYVAAGGPGYTGPADAIGRKSLEAETSYSPLRYP